MSTSSFIELPDDILFTIVKFVRVPDLFAARKTCKRLHSITLDRHVWITAYNTSENSFLPETSLASKTVQDLERLLLRSYRLNTFWANPPRIKRVFKRRISLDSTTSGIDIKNLLAIELFQGRFIILQTAKAMLVYDLETRDEVFRHNAAPNQEFKRAVLGLNRTADYNMDLFFPFRTFSFITGTSVLSMCKISPSGSVTIAESPLLNANFVIGNQFAVIHNFGRGRASDVLVVSHLESQNIYPLSSGFLDEPHDPRSPIQNTTIFLPGGYALLHFAPVSIQLGTPVKHYFELYCMPDHTILPTGTSLSPTHRGHFPQVDCVVKLLSSVISPQNNYSGSSIWLLVRLYKVVGLHLLHITFRDEGRLAFHLSLARPNDIWDLHLTANSDGRARGIARKGEYQEQHWILCDIDMNSDEEPVIHTATVDVLEDKSSYFMALDVSRGMLINHEFGRDQIHILDLVV